MKILYIGMKYDYGKVELGYSFEQYNFYHTLVHMNNKKHQVIHFPYDEHLAKLGKAAMNKLLLKTVKTEKPDLCFFLLFEDEITFETIQEITKNSGATTFNWFGDDNWRFHSFSRHYAPAFHWVSTTVSKALTNYKRIGFNGALETQWACNHFLYKPALIKDKTLIDISFIGQPHGDRKKIIQKIKDANIDITCLGNGWPSGRISQEKMINLFTQSKINLNLVHTSVVNKWTLKNMLSLFLKKNGSFVKPRNFSEMSERLSRLVNIQNDQIKGRNFEVPGCGGFLLTDYATDLEKYYIDGKEIVIFKNTKDLVEKIQYYLNNDDERKAISKAAYERTMKEHTYEKRFNKLFKEMGLI